MKNFTIANVVALVIWALPVVYLLAVYDALPQTVPMHYGISGKPDRYGDRSEMILLQAVFSVIGGGVYLLLNFITMIDPKKKVQYSEATYQKMGMGVLVFMTALNICIIYATRNQGLQFEKIILPIVGLFFVFLGNVMYSIKPNYFAGVRTPWTLEDEDNWRATHQLAGKLWFVGGIALTILMLLLHGQAAFVVFMSGVLVMSFVPILYSYLYFKKHRTQ